MFEEFYEMYEPEEQEVVALINRCIGGGYNWKGKFWEMTVVTLGMVFCDTGKVTTKEEQLDWPVTDEERNGEKGWGRFQKEQICRLKIRRMKEEPGTRGCSGGIPQAGGYPGPGAGRTDTGQGLRFL